MSANDNKKYYWLKLKKDFFQQHQIRILKGMPNGKDYLIFYLQLMCESTSHEGKLRFSDTIPYSLEMLSSLTDTNIDIVRSAIEALQGLGLIEVLDDATIYMTEVNKMLGQETGSAQRKREYRENIKDNIGTIGGQCLLEYRDKSIEYRDKSIDINKEEKEKKKSTSRFQKPSLSEIQEYIIDNNYSVDANKFFDYYESNGWKVGKNSMKDWKACVRTWQSKEKNNKKVEDWQFE